MADDKKPMTTNQAIATGRCYVNYDPLDVLEELRAAVSCVGGKYVIVLGESHDSYKFKRLLDCIAFNRGIDRGGEHD